MEKHFRVAVSAAVLVAMFAVAAVAQTSCPDPPTSSNTGPYCQGGTILLFASSTDPAATYSWSGPNGYTSDGQTAAIANADPMINAGAYTVTVNGCTATTAVVVNPNFAIAAPTCATTTSTGSNGRGPDGAASYSWSISNGAITAGQDAQTVTFTAGAVGTLTLTLNTGCCTSSQDVRVDPQPTISIGNARGQTGPKGTLTPFNFNISLSSPSTQTVTVQYFTSNQTALGGRDYVVTSGTVTFFPGDTMKTVSVNVYGTTSNPQKLFAVNLYNPVNATIQLVGGYPSRGQAVILAK
jgi:hypothetical protein